MFFIRKLLGRLTGDKGDGLDHERRLQELRDMRREAEQLLGKDRKGPEEQAVTQAARRTVKFPKF